MAETFKERLLDSKSRKTARERYDLASGWHYTILRRFPTEEIEQVMQIAAGFDPDDVNTNSK